MNNQNTVSPAPASICRVLLFAFVIGLLTGSCSYERFARRHNKLRDSNLEPYDAIIVPGYPYTGAPWNRVVELRITWATYLFRKGYARNIIFSGAAVYSPYIESRVMAMYATKLGVPTGNIFTEERAEHSTENVYYSYVLGRRMGFRRMAIATDPFQARNLKRFIRKYEIPAELLPAIYDTIRKTPLKEPVIDPATAFQEDFVSLDERKGFFRRLRGTLGFNIMWHTEDLKKKRFRRQYRHRIVPQQSKQENKH